MSEVTYVILAAGRGTRMGRIGEHLHKSLVPLDNKALLTRVIELAPDNANIVIVIGHKSDQVYGYLRLAHPYNRFTIVEDNRDWHAPGGPGASLHAAKDHIVGDLIVTCCDTLHSGDVDWRSPDYSWVGVADIPEGSDPKRWCRVADDEEFGTVFADKLEPNQWVINAMWKAFIGLAYIKQEDLNDFWINLEVKWDLYPEDELQLTPGLVGVSDISSREINGWIDVGDEKSYEDAKRTFNAFDMDKPDTATYVLPDEWRVVKFWDNSDIVRKRVFRSVQLGHVVVPDVIASSRDMLAYRYVPGITGYELAELDVEPGWTVSNVIDWAARRLWNPREVEPVYARRVAYSFYFDKTIERINMLSDELRSYVMDCIKLIDFEWLCHDVQPVTFHGDFHLGNIIHNSDRGFKAVDWRESFGECTTWGDKRHDVAKLVAGMIVHWDNAKNGDFTVWNQMSENIEAVNPTTNEMIIAGLCLINSAPLHASPLDEVAAVRGANYVAEAYGK